MTWLDSRLKKPTSNHFASYLVAFLYCESVFVGFADWVPKDNYTDGEWQNTRCTNGNRLEGQVLYWTEHPKKPDICGEG